MYNNVMRLFISNRRNMGRLKADLIPGLLNFRINGIGKAVIIGKQTGTITEVSFTTDNNKELVIRENSSLTIIFSPKNLHPIQFSGTTVYKITELPDTKFTTKISFSKSPNLISVPTTISKHITDMSYMFNMCTSFNGDISKWNVKNVKNMAWMFFNTPFNQNISKWDVSNVTNMSHMFGSTIYTEA